MRMFLLTAALVAGLSAAQADAQNVYMTGSNPWGNTTNDAAMNAAFGAGNWTKFNTFDASVFTAGNQFIFIDGSDLNGVAFSDFVTTNLAAITSYVNSGGSLFANMASNVGPNELSGPFGSTWTYPVYNDAASLTAAGVAAGLGANGAGTTWTGNSFGHNTVSNGTCYVTGSLGCVFAGGVQGAGAYFSGGQKTTNFHSTGSAQLLVNQLQFAAAAVAAPAVPEPATWGMMILGFGAIGLGMRRRRSSVRTTVRFA